MNKWLSCGEGSERSQNFLFGETSGYYDTFLTNCDRAICYPWKGNKNWINIETFQHCSAEYFPLLFIHFEGFEGIFFSFKFLAIFPKFDWMIILFCLEHHKLFCFFFFELHKFDYHFFFLFENENISNIIRFADEGKRKQ